MKFFTKREDKQSSAVGGVLTLFFVFLLIVISFKFFLDTFLRANYNLEQIAVPFKDNPEVLNMKISDFLSTTLMQPNILVYHKNLSDCSSMSIGMKYDSG